MSSQSKTLTPTYKSAEDRERHRQELSSLVDIDGVKYHFVLYKGIPVSPFPGVKRRIEEYRQRFLPRPSDVWVCAYVKSGTHWVCEMAHMLLRKTTEPPAIKEDFMLERVDCSALASLRSPRLLNTHLHFSQMPSQIVSPGAGKVIFITRDIRDVAVSLYYHQMTRAADNLTRYATTWQAHVDTFCKGLSQNGSWFHYVQSWHEGLLSKSPPHVLHLTYESMLADHRGTVDKLAEFLLGTNHGMEPAFLDQVRAATEFEQMRRAHTGKIAINIYRGGRRGDWRSHFSELELFDLRAAVFEPLSAEEKRLFLQYAGMRDWSSG